MVEILRAVSCHAKLIKHVMSFPVEPMYGLATVQFIRQTTYRHIIPKTKL